MTPRIVTGLSVLSSLGVHGADEFFAAAKEITPPASPEKLASFDASKYGGTVPVLEVPGFDPTKHLGDKGLRTLDRLTKLLVVAARICLHDAGFKKDNAWVDPGLPTKVGVCCSNAYGSLEAIHELDAVAKLEDARYINPAKFPNTVSNSAAGYISIWEDLRALNVSVSDGVCGGLDTIATSDVFLATGRADAILAGGGEAMSEALYLAFAKLGLLGASERVGEAAAFFALEEEATAKARGAKRLGAITGYGTAFVGPADADDALVFYSKEALKRAVETALADAGVSDVDLVVMSSGTRRGADDIVFEVTRTLSMTAPIADGAARFGETLGASGALGIAAALAALNGSRAGRVRPTSERRELEETNARAVDTVLVTSLGHYGNASAVVVRR